jgi:putative drug exporter of the RND superfamily
MYLGGALQNEQSFTNDPESSRAQALVDKAFPGTDQTRELVIIKSADHTVDDAQFRAQAQAVTSQVMALGSDVVAGYADYTTDPNPVLISADRHSALLLFTMTKPVGDAGDDAGALATTVREAVAGSGFDAFVTGEASINSDFGATAESDLRTGEIFGVGIALVILVLVFGAVVTAAVPLVMALASILLAMGITALVGRVMDLSFFITNMITMIGLAMGTDYSLFVVSRYREERAAGHDKIEAVCRAGSTATRSVVFSALAVILALGGLFLVPSTLFHSMAMGAIIAVFTALLAALTLLPALLGALGDKVNALRVPFLKRSTRGAGARDGGFWSSLTRGVMRRPVTSLVLAAGFLAVLAGVYFSIDLGSAGVETLPASMASRQGFDVLQKEFPGASMQPVEVTISGDPQSPAVTQGIANLRAALAGDPAFMGDGTTRVSPDGTLTVLSLVVLGEPNGQAAQAAVRHLRADYLPAAFSGPGLVAGTDVLTTGQTAFVIDYLDTINSATGWVFLFVLGLSFMLLLVVFRSILVPLKAILMNLLSVGAAYGLMVAVFQKGWGADLLGLQKVDFVEAWVPLFLFAVLFLRGPLRDLHGLPRVPAQPHPRAVRPDRRQSGVGGVRAAADRRDHHRGSAHHGGGVRRVRRRRPGDVPATRLRTRGGGVPRRDSGPLLARTGRDAPARRRQLVVPEVVALAARSAGGRRAAGGPGAGSRSRAPRRACARPCGDQPGVPPCGGERLTIERPIRRHPPSPARTSSTSGCPRPGGPLGLEPPAAGTRRLICCP